MGRRKKIIDVFTTTYCPITLGRPTKLMLQSFLKMCDIVYNKCKEKELENRCKKCKKQKKNWPNELSFIYIENN